MSYEESAPPAPSDAKQEEGWVLIQKKTFTKWCNNHLTKKGFPIIKDAQTDFETGVYLGNIVRALYPDVPAPKFNKDPKLRPHKLDNITLALKMVEDAHIKTNFLKSTHLIDHDLKMILGMMWAIILDYAIKGISVEELTAKEGLLLWCRKKTAGYRDVDPPSIQNFTRDWRNGLAFCALIHRHQPHLIDYDSLDKTNAAENLELAFSIAERELGIPRLLDIEDLTTEKPDERSVMTYVSEYFHRFAGQDLRELAARRCAKFLQFTRTMADLKNDYEEQARALIQWTNDTISNFQSAQFGDSIDDAITVNANLREFVLTIKPQRAAQKLDLESLFAEIQTQLRVNNRPSYEPPHDVAPEAIEEHFNHLWESEKQYGKLARENRFKFIKKTETKLSEEKLQEFRDSFAHFDANNNGWLDKVEFKAALSALSIPFKDDAEFTKVFTQVAEGEPHITQDSYIRYLTALSEDKDTAEQIKQSFAAIADGGKYITAQQLRTPPLTDEDIAFLLKNLPSAGGDVEAYDYSTFVDNNFATHE